MPFLRDPRRRRGALIALPALAVLAVLAVAGWIIAGRDDSGGAGAPRSQGSQAQKPLPPGPRLFSPSSVWNKPLAGDSPLDPRSQELVGGLRQEVAREHQKGNGPALAAGSYSTPLYRVPKGQPTVKVALKDPGKSWRRSLQAAFEAVPLPPDAKPAKGTDGHLTVWQPSTDKLWEFFQARRDSGGGWHASWGGAIRHVSKSPGYFTERAWPGAATYWGATATSLPVIGGTMLLGEIRRGQIDHALAMNVPFARSGAFSRPAQRSDGLSHSPDAIPEGARFRLDPKLDIDGLKLPRLTAMMARAAQRYGIIVRDQTAEAVGFFAEDPTPTGSNPFSETDGTPRTDGPLQGTYAVDLLARFPWERLQLMKMDLVPDRG